MNYNLAPRETEYVHHVADDKSGKDIAREINITLHSVRFMVRRVRFKLGADNKTEVAAHAIRDNLAGLCFVVCIAGETGQGAHPNQYSPRGKNEQR